MRELLRGGRGGALLAMAESNGLSSESKLSEDDNR